MLRSAHAMAVELGAVPFQTQIEDLATRARISLDASVPTADDAPVSVVDSTPDALADLTSREREVLALVADGRSNREVAETLFISEKTVERHRANVLEKLGLRDRVALTRYAIRWGLIEP